MLAATVTAVAIVSVPVYATEPDSVNDDNVEVVWPVTVTTPVEPVLTLLIVNVGIESVNAPTLIAWDPVKANVDRLLPVIPFVMTEPAALVVLSLIVRVPIVFKLLRVVIVKAPVPVRFKFAKLGSVNVEMVYIPLPTDASRDMLTVPTPKALTS